MSESSDPNDNFSPQDNLPEVTPPSAGFILQLFVIPAAIVLVIIMVWLMFVWLADMGGGPKDYIEDIQRNKANSWQVAYNLTQELRRDAVYRNDLELSDELARMLDERLGEPLPDDAKVRKNEIMLRVFLAKALGEFEVANHSLPVLLKGAGDVESEKVAVRKASLESLALLASHVAGKPLRERNPALVEMLIDATNDDDHEVAERATFALSLVGGPAAVGRLEQLVSGQAYPNVRYNAATGLARTGNEAAIPVLLEMLDPSNTVGLDIEERQGMSESEIEASKRTKKAMLLLNGLRSVRELAKQNDTVDLTPARSAVQRIIELTNEKQLRLEAADVLDALDARREKLSTAAVGN